MDEMNSATNLNFISDIGSDANVKECDVRREKTRTYNASKNIMCQKTSLISIRFRLHLIFSRRMKISRAACRQPFAANTCRILHVLFVHTE